MKQVTKKLILAYSIIVLIKIILAYFISSPTGFWDEYINSKIARSIFSIKIINILPEYQLLYPSLLSITYFAKNMEIIYFLIKVINAFISTSIIIPAYLLSREFLKEKQQIYIPILISILPANFSFSNYILAENLFYPLFLFSIYFIYKSSKENIYKNNILAAIFISLSFSTKQSGFLLIFIYFITHIVKIIVIKEKLKIKNLILVILIMSLFILPLLFSNYQKNGFSLTKIFGVTVKDNLESLTSPTKHEGYYFFSLTNWIIMNTVITILASGIIFFFSSLLILNKIKNKNNLSIFIILVIVTFIICILAVSNNALGPQPVNLPKIFSYFTSRPISRYLSMLTPLLIVLGTVGLNDYYEKQTKISLKKIIFISLPFFIISSQLSLDSLLPINNISISFIGILKIIINYLINGTFIPDNLFDLPVFLIMLLLFITLPFTALLISKLNIKKMFCLFLVFLIITNSINFSINYYKSKEWSKNEQMQLGLWFNENDKKISNILFDINDGVTRKKGSPFSEFNSLFEILNRDQYLTLVGFWMNDNLLFDNVDKLENIDYVISTKKLNLPLLKETEKINVYKIKK